MRKANSRCRVTGLQGYKSYRRGLQVRRKQPDIILCLQWCTPPLIYCL